MFPTLLKIQTFQSKLHVSTMYIALNLCETVCLFHQITELSSELADERNTGESASQLLEAETSDRLRLEKDLKDLQVE